MKVSRANLIWGISAVFVSSASSALASEVEVSQFEVSPFVAQPAIFSAKALIDQSAFVLSPAFDLESAQFDYSISIEDKNYVQNLLAKESLQPSFSTSIANEDFVNKQVVALKKKPYFHHDVDEDIIIGKPLSLIHI